MGKKLLYALGLVLTFAATLRADVTVSDGSPVTFGTAVETVKGTGGGTITVTTPIVIADSTNGAADETFDGESLVTVSGGNTNSIFIISSGSLTLENMTVENGAGRFGGAISNSDAGTLTLTGCTFFNNHARGADGVSAITDTNGSGNVAIGKNGKRGTAGETAFGGAIYNLGALTIGDCKFITNSAVGGTGGDGSDGQSAGTRGGNGGAGGAGGSAGGGVFNVGTLVISNSTFSGNAASGGSGGIGGVGGGAIISGVNGSAGAAGVAAGGGLYTAATDAFVLNSTFDNNDVNGGDGQTGGTSGSGVGQNGPRGGDALGAGIENSGALGVTNSTFYKNTATGGDGGDGGEGGVKGGNGGVGGSAIGGGIYNSGIITVVNCTFSKGSASGGTAGSAGSGALPGKNGKTGSSFGGNIANVAKKRGLGFTLANSILGTALSGNDASGKIIDDGYNIIADKSIKFKKSSTNLVNTNALAGGGDIADNGGPTETIALSTNSPAVDFIKSDATFAPPSTDQRGEPRPFGSFSDAGAFELDPTQLTIPGQPQDVSVLVGSNATFTVGVSGMGPIFYQWFFSNSPLSGATSPSLLITNAQTSNAGPYFVMVSNAFNSATSRVATLTVNQATNFPPVITNEPAGTQSATVGDPVTFTVGVTGDKPLFFQWFFKSSTAADFTSFLGATNPVLTIPSVQLTNQGSYFVNITNRFGSTNSTLSSLFVNPASTNGGGGITPPQ